MTKSETGLFIRAFEFVSSFDIRHSSLISRIDMDGRLAIDSAVLLLYFFVIIFIGLRMGRKERDLEDFALGRRQIPWWAVFASIIAAETSAGTFFGTPGEGFALRNYTYIQLAFGTILARILVSYIFIKPYYDYKVFSIYEYLTARFGVATKNAASAVFMFTRVLASGARLYVAAIALVLAYEMIRGTRPGQTETLLIYIGAPVVIVILTAIYTTIGGIKAVVWTDFIQASIMMGSALVALGLLYSAIPGGWHKIAELHGGFHLSDVIATGLDPAKSGWDRWKGMFEIEYTIFAGLIGSTFITMATHGTDQDMVQRMLTAPDIRRSRRSLILPVLAGMLTTSRGSDRGNVIAMITGFIVVTILSDLANTIARLFGTIAYVKPAWLPSMEFPWWICFGTIVTFFVAILFRTGREHHPPA